MSMGRFFFSICERSSLNNNNNNEILMCIEKEEEKTIFSVDLEILDSYLFLSF